MSKQADNAPNIATPPNPGAAVLIVEDDSDQMDMFVRIVAAEANRLLKGQATTAQQIKMLSPFNILRVGEMKSLEQAVVTGENIIMVILDCNIPDAKGEAPHDQFVKQDKHKVTGQHKSVDLIAEYLPGTPITLTSSMRRFQRTITRFYKDRSELQLDFVSKDEVEKIQANIAHQLRAYVGQGG